MNPEHAALLQRLNAFNFDAPDATFPFSSRLAKENQWSPSYARRVIAEYKRFTFLAVAAGDEGKCQLDIRLLVAIEPPG